MGKAILLLAVLAWRGRTRRVQLASGRLQGTLDVKGNESEPSNSLANLLFAFQSPAIYLPQGRPTVSRHSAIVDNRRSVLESPAPVMQKKDFPRLVDASMSVAEQPQDSDHSSHGALRDLGGLFVLVLPTVATWLASPVLSMVDAAVVGRAAAASSSGVDLAALGAALLACDYPGYILTAALSTATTVLTAKELASGGKKASQAIAGIGAYAAGLVGVLFGATMFVGSIPLLRLIVPQHNHGLLIAPAAEYVKIRMLAAPFMMLETVLQAWFLGRKDPVTPLLVTILAAVVNLVLDIVLCIGCNMGLAGAAWATSFSQIIACAAITWYYKKVAGRDVKEDSKRIVDGLVPQVRTRKMLAQEFCSMSIPTAGVVFTKVVTYGGTAIAAQQLGVISGAADMLMSNIFFFFAVFGDAVSSVAQSALPAHLPPMGSFRDASRWSLLISVVGLSVGIFNSGTSAILATLGSTIFTKDIAVLQGMRSIVPIMAGALLLHAFSMASEGILFASQRMRFMTVSYALNAGLALASMYAAVQNGLTLTGIWLIKIQFQLVRIFLNGGLILSPWSPLRQNRA